MKKKPKINKNIVFSVLLLAGIAFSIVTIVTAVAPNPGHNFTESSGGVVQGDLLYGSAADILSALPKDTNATRYISNTGDGINNPAWAQVNLTNGVSGILPGVNGGTGATNNGKTITLGGNFATAGAFNVTLTATADSNLTLPAGTKTLVATDVTALSSLNSVGVITTGTWSADVIADGKIAPALTGKTYNSLALTAQGTGFTIAGGTVSKTLTVTEDAVISGTPISNPMSALGDIIYGGAGGAVTRLGGSAGFLKSTGAAAPAWSPVNLAASADVNGILAVANGGTGNANGTANIAGGTPGAIPYQSAANATAVLDAAAAANKVLMSGASAAPTWSIPAFPNVSAAARKIIVSDGTNWVASAETYAEPGTAGNLLASDGVNWVSAAGGVLIGVQTLLIGATEYIPAPGTNKIVVELWGGGGAGGSCTAVAGCAGGGGGSGGYAMGYFTGIGAGSYPVAIGAGGAAVAGGTGGAGGATTGGGITANGGSGGATAAGTAAIKYVAGGAGGVISINGTINGAGVPGGAGMTSTVRTTGASGYGGSTSLGGGGASVTGNVAATSAAGVSAVANTGSGGSGARAGANAAVLGGAGAAGRIIIYEYR